MQSLQCFIKHAMQACKDNMLEEGRGQAKSFSCTSVFESSEDVHVMLRRGGRACVCA